MDLYGTPQTHFGGLNRVEGVKTNGFQMGIPITLQIALSWAYGLRPGCEEHAMYQCTPLKTNC